MKAKKTTKQKRQTRRRKEKQRLRAEREYLINEAVRTHAAVSRAAAERMSNETLRSLLRWNTRGRAGFGQALAMGAAAQAAAAALFLGRRG